MPKSYVQLPTRRKLDLSAKPQRVPASQQQCTNVSLKAIQSKKGRSYHSPSPNAANDCNLRAVSSLVQKHRNVQAAKNITTHAQAGVITSGQFQNFSTLSQASLKPSVPIEQPQLMRGQTPKVIIDGQHSNGPARVLSEIKDTAARRRKDKSLSTQ